MYQLPVPDRYASSWFITLHANRLEVVDGVGAHFDAAARDLDVVFFLARFLDTQ